MTKLKFRMLDILVKRKGGADKMTCTIKGLTQPICLTLIYNLSSRLLVDSFIDCGNCELGASLDPNNRNLTIKVPLTIGGEVTFTDNLQSGCVTTLVELTKQSKKKEK
ncbi:hypothetical protein [Peribacillus simplex]|uniref:hypothetical protein n=1 Tax=Peribacillus simplex TaxID=1478 RepID=UPI0024C1DEA7|nr:hypothetical protein [Peribacillus simplex]WHY58359.1 hypothetical protein QNH43_08885 [Peribacillus simplex]